MLADLFSLIPDNNAVGSWSSMEFLMRNKVRKNGDSFQCLLCFKCIKRMTDVKKHMRAQHCVLASQYFCPSCDKWFRIKKSMYDHVRNNHRDWNVSD